MKPSGAMSSNDSDPGKSETTMSETSCRVCLEQVQPEASNLFKPWREPWEGMAATVAEDLNKLTQIEVSPLDIHSKLICDSCLTRLREACTFVVFTRKNDIVLNKKPVNGSVSVWPHPIRVDMSVFDNPIEVEVKQEVLSEGEENESTEMSTQKEFEIKVEPEEISEQDTTSAVNDKPTTQIITNGDLFRLLVEQNKGHIIYNKLFILRKQLTSCNNINRKNDPLAYAQFDSAFSKFRRKLLKGWLQARRKITRFRNLHQTWINEPFQYKLKCLPDEPMDLENAVKIPVIKKSDRKYFNVEYLDSTVKDEPMETYGEEETSDPSGLPLDCMLCTKNFKSVSGLKAHVIAQHSYETVLKRKAEGGASSEKMKPNNVCSTCRRSFTTPTDLMVHSSCHHDTVCYACGMAFINFGQLTKHRRRCKGKEEKAKLITLEDVKRPVVAEPSEELQIKEPSAIIEDEKLKQNTQTVEVQELKCTHCPEVFEDVYYKKIHEEVHNLGTCENGNAAVEREQTQQISQEENIEKSCSDSVKGEADVKSVGDNELEDILCSDDIDMSVKN